MSAFRRSDLFCGLLAAALAFVVYLATLAPSVTLEDSGEFITAAVHFGVPHPPGYPLWTWLGWIFSHAIPFGNLAWRVNLLSAVAGALAVGVTAMLGRWTVRGLLCDAPAPHPSLGRGRDVGEQSSQIATVSSLSAAWILAFSDVMWSQSVIAEVYTLNALCLSLTLLFFALWSQRPRQTRWLLAAGSAFAVGMTNHQTLLFLLPGLLAGVWWRRQRWWPDVGVGTALAGGIPFAFFCWLSRDAALIETGARVLMAGGLLCLVLLFWRGWRIRWRLVLGLPAVACLSLCLYALLPLASSTNPPMNWGYARELSGFYHLVGRGQYADGMGELIRRWISPAAGISLPRRPPPPPEETSRPTRLANQIFLYGQSLRDNLSLPVVLLALASLPLLTRTRGRSRPWLLFLGSCFVCLSVLQILVMNPGLDKASQWVGRTFFLQSHLLFSLWVAAALGRLWQELLRRLPPSISPLLWTTCALPIFPLTLNHEACSQRGHWFGWQYGTEMLSSLPPGAVLFGGTDPGRFIPTYMIFCESRQPPRWKQDPFFDRRDLYIITQNALADGTYLHYLRDHYSSQRPPTPRWARGWLERETLYPAQPLILPSIAELDDLFKKAVQERRASDEMTVLQLNSAVSQKIFHDNRGQHRFYLEESFAMDWYYPHAIPDGLLLRLEPEPIAKLDAKTVEQDQLFWDRLLNEKLSDPRFLRDGPARRAFSKLRSSIANIYAWREMHERAEAAFRQSLALAPDNTEATLMLCHFYRRTGRKAEAAALLTAALRDDPHCPELAAEKMLLDTPLPRKEKP